MAVGVFLPQSRRKKKSKKTTKVQLMGQKLGMLKENMTSIYIYIPLDDSKSFQDLRGCFISIHKHEVH